MVSEDACIHMCGWPANFLCWCLGPSVATSCQLSLYRLLLYWNRGIFVTGSSLVGAAIRVPRITSKNLIRCAQP